MSWFPVAPRWGRFNLGDRVDQGNLAFLAEVSPATERGGGIGAAAAADPRSQLSRSSIHAGAEPIRQKA